MRYSCKISKAQLQILQNIQDQIQCKKFKTYGDMLAKRTKDPDIANNTKLRKIEDEKDDFGMNIDGLSALIEAQEFAGALHSVDNESGMNGKTFEVLKERFKLSNNLLVSVNSRVHSVFQHGINDGEDAESDYLDGTCQMLMGKKRKRLLIKLR